MPRIQVARIYTDKKISENQRLKIRFISACPDSSGCNKKEWNPEVSGQA